MVEQKPLGAGLKDSQSVVLGLLATAIKVLVLCRILHSQSGVFLVQSDAPFDMGVITQIGGDFRQQLSGEAFRLFKICEPLPAKAPSCPTA